MKNEKFNHDKHIIDNYISNDKAVIKVLINDNLNFYNEFDPRKISINKNVAEYITEEASNIPFKYNIVVEFSSSYLSENEKAKISKMLKNYYALKICNKDSIIRVNIVKSLCLILLGALMVTYSLIGKKLFGLIYEEVVYVIGWVLLWEGIDILLLSNNEHKVEKKNYQQLYDAQVIFSDKLELKD